MAGKTVKVQRVERPPEILNPEDIVASFCYHFPQYTFAEAKKMPYSRIQKMLRVAKREHARKMMDLVQIVAAPHSNKGAMVKNLLDYFKDIAEGKI